MDLELDLDDWEMEIANILGATKEELKNMTEDELDKLMFVSHQSLTKYCRYIKKHITFPFQGSYEIETGLFDAKHYDVTCIQFDQQIELDAFYGILVECKQGRKKRIVPLGEIDVDESNENYKLIELYKDWFWNFR